MSVENTVRDHYSSLDASNDLISEITRRLDALGEGPRTAADLAALDQFHLRGIVATQELADLVGISGAWDVLDAGSGIGGPSRYLAETYGCRVIGVDLTPSFVEVAELLARRSALGDRVAYRVGDLQDLPFEDATFDLVWTQHVVMNVPDRARVYREFRRVLRSRGMVAFYDVVAADEKPETLLPVPWSQSPQTNHLLTRAETVNAFEHAGLHVQTWRDLTEEAVAWLAQPRQPATQSLSLATIVGPRLGEMMTNFGRNLREGRVRVAMGTCVVDSARAMPSQDAP